NNADESIRVGLEQTGQRISDILEQQRDGLLRRSQLFVAQPSFPSTVGAAIASTDMSTLFDQAHTAAEEIGASWTQIIGPDGTRVAKSDEPTAEWVDLTQSSLISGALEGKPTAGFGVANDTSLFDAIAIRVGNNASSPA